jgi:hypothetical protein
MNGKTAKKINWIDAKYSMKSEICWLVRWIQQRISLLYLKWFCMTVVVVSGTPRHRNIFRDIWQLYYSRYTYVCTYACTYAPLQGQWKSKPIRMHNFSCSHVLLDPWHIPYYVCIYTAAQMYICMYAQFLVCRGNPVCLYVQNMLMYIRIQWTLCNPTFP